MLLGNGIEELMWYLELVPQRQGCWGAAHGNITMKRAWGKRGKTSVMKDILQELTFGGSVAQIAGWDMRPNGHFGVITNLEISKISICFSCVNDYLKAEMKYPQHNYLKVHTT